MAVEKSKAAPAQPSGAQTSKSKPPEKPHRLTRKKRRRLEAIASMREEEESEGRENDGGPSSSAIFTKKKKLKVNPAELAKTAQAASQAQKLAARQVRCPNIKRQRGGRCEG